MAMWGSWLEKGKALAANIDKQLNDSVGIDTATERQNVDGTTGEMLTTEEDAWNDGFDDVDVDDDNDNDTPLAKQETHKVVDGWGNEDDNGELEDDEEEVILMEPTPSIETLSNPPVDTVTFVNDVSPLALESIVAPPASELVVDDTDPPPLFEQPMLSIAPEPEPLAEEAKEPAVSEPVELGVADLDAGDPEPPGGESGWDEEINVDEDENEEAHSDEYDHQNEAMEPTVIDVPLSPPDAIIVIEPTVLVDPPAPPPPEWETPTVVPSLITTDENNTRSLPEEPEDRQRHDEKLLQIQEEHQMALVLMQSEMEDLQRQLRQREDQLTSKAEQVTTLQAMWESEKDALQRKVTETKEEAKKRIVKAKERVEAMERRLKDASKSAEDAGAQSELIAALREEGEKLARKQSEMERAVRAARGEARELTAQLEEEMESKQKALDKIVNLESDLKFTKEELAAARRGENQAGKLEAELASVKEECEMKAAANLSLEQQVKELKSEAKELRNELEEARRGAALESEMESLKLKKEHGNLLADLETKLRTSEREANIREDALRHEVAELRKRWQDAVRRADALSMDVQQSTAPLLRQLESMERQNRARAAAWTELETKLRTDLEDNIIQNENLVKERNELKVNCSRLQRMMKDRDDELNICKVSLEDQTLKLKQLETKLAEMETERQRLKEEYNEIEKLANEGVSKVRSDLMQTVVESEERYRAQKESIEKELEDERNKRSQLERQVEQLLENSGIMPFSGPQAAMSRDVKEKKLRSTTGQAEILANTLTGFDSDYDDDASGPLDDADDSGEGSSRGGLSSFAAMEQLNQRLRGSKLELEALRKQLAESNKTQESLLLELRETRQAREKLPFFEEKVKELQQDNNEKELELMSLRDDISEVRLLYRTQLNSLLEEKAAAFVSESSKTNGSGPATHTDDDVAPDEQLANNNDGDQAPSDSEQPSSDEKQSY